MYNGPLYKSCLPCPWGPYGPRPRGCHGKNIKKIFFSKTTRPKAFIFCMKQCLVVLYINPANHAPGVKNGPAPGVISSHRLTMGKTKNLLLQNHKAQSFHILSVAMYSGPLYKSCQPCPCGPHGPRPGGVMGKT